MAHEKGNLLVGTTSSLYSSMGSIAAQCEGAGRLCVVGWLRDNSWLGPVAGWGSWAVDAAPKLSPWIGWYHGTIFQGAKIAHNKTKIQTNVPS
jgi:hypothetical protein